MLLLLLCSSRYFYQFSCPGLLQLLIWVFLSVLLSLPSPVSPPATNQIQIGQRRIWHFLARKQNHLQWRSCAVSPVFLHFYDLIQNSLVMVTEGNFDHLFLSHEILLNNKNSNNGGKNVESSYAAYLYVPPYEMEVIFLTLAGCFFFSLPGNKMKKCSSYVNRNVTIDHVQCSLIIS